MNIFGIGQSTGIDQIAAIQGRRNFASETPNSGTQGDTVSISDEARVLFLNSQNKTEASSIAQSVSNYMDSKIGTGPTTTQYSDWLPENYAKFKEIQENNSVDAWDKGYSEQVFAALGSQKILTDAELAEGIQAVKDYLNAPQENPQTAEDMDLRLPPAGEELTALNDQYAYEKKEAEKNLEEWLKEQKDTPSVNNTTTATSQNTLEMYQIPSWYAEMMPIYSAEIGGQSSIKVQDVSREHNSAWESYTSSMGKHYEDVLADHNIGDSVEERYNALIADSAQSLRIKNDFYNRVAADEELQGLMSSLGVQLPA